MSREYWNGAEAAHRRVMMKAAGYSDEDIRHKPHIGVPNTYMAGSPGTAHLRQITEAVKEGIWAAGGIPVEFGVPATCGNIANGAEELKFEQVGRDIVAMSIEFVSRVHNFDGLAMIASCDNIIAGCYLAAMRLDIPSILIAAIPVTNTVSTSLSAIMSGLAEAPPLCPVYTSETMWLSAAVAWSPRISPTTASQWEILAVSSERLLRKTRNITTRIENLMQKAMKIYSVI